MVFKKAVLQLQLIALILNLIVCASANGAENRQLVQNYAKMENWPKPVSYALKCANLLSFLATYPFFSKSKSKYEKAYMDADHWVIDLDNGVYFLNGELKQREIDYDQGTSKWIYASSGRPVGEGTYLLVMDPQGKIFIDLKPSDVNHIFHSSLSLGWPVAAAGEANFDSSSAMRKYETQTGHYWRSFRTEDLNWQQLMNELKDRGVNPKDIEITSIVIDGHGARRNTIKLGVN